MRRTRKLNKKVFLPETKPESEVIVRSLVDKLIFETVLLFDLEEIEGRMPSLCFERLDCFNDQLISLSCLKPPSEGEIKVNISKMVLD